MHELAVLLPTLRMDDWLSGAVESVLSDLPAGVLVVLLDGGEVDESARWLSDDRVILRRTEQRRGVAWQLDAAIKAVPAEYYARLDADDISLPGRFQAQLDVLSGDPAVVLVAGEAELMDEGRRPLGAFGAAKGEDIRESLLSRNRIVHSAVMFRATSYFAAGGYSRQLRQMEDYHLWLRLGLLGQVTGLERQLVRYRLHDSQVSRAARPWGAHIAAVQSARGELARHLGVGRWAARALAIKWWCAQLLRYLRLRTPGYDSAAKRVENEQANDA